MIVRFRRSSRGRRNHEGADVNVLAWIVIAAFVLALVFPYAHELSAFAAVLGFALAVVVLA